MEEKLVRERRKYLRFNPLIFTEAGEEYNGQSVLAFLDDDPKTEEFTPNHIGFIAEEGHKGCGLVFVKRKNEVVEFNIGQEFQMKVGRLHPLRGVVRWRNDLDQDVVKVGFEYLE